MHRLTNLKFKKRKIAFKYSRNNVEINYVPSTKLVTMYVKLLQQM